MTPKQRHICFQFDEQELEPIDKLLEQGRITPEMAKLWRTMPGKTSDTQDTKNQASRASESHLPKTRLVEIPRPVCECTAPATHALYVWDETLGGYRQAGEWCEACGQQMQAREERLHACGQTQQEDTSG